MRNSTRLLTLSLAVTLAACSETTTFAPDRPQFDSGFIGGGGRSGPTATVESGFIGGGGRADTTVVSPQ